MTIARSFNCARETPFGLAYLGIIDILTQYGAAKAAENFVFRHVHVRCDDISCRPRTCTPGVFERSSIGCS